MIFIIFIAIVITVFIVNLLFYISKKHEYKDVLKYLYIIFGSVVVFFAILNFYINYFQYVTLTDVNQIDNESDIENGGFIQVIEQDDVKYYKHKNNNLCARLSKSGEVTIFSIRSAFYAHHCDYDDGKPDEAAPLSDREMMGDLTVDFPKDLIINKQN